MDVASGAVLLPSQRSLASLQAVSLRNVFIPATSGGVPALFFVLSSASGAVVYQSECISWTVNPSWRLSWEDVSEDRRALSALSSLSAVKLQLFSKPAEAGGRRGWGIGGDGSSPAEPSHPFGTLYPEGGELHAPGTACLFETPLDFTDLRFLPFNVFAALASVGKAGPLLSPGGRRDKEREKERDGKGEGGGVDGAEADLSSAEACGYALDALPFNTLLLSFPDGEYITPHTALALTRGAPAGLGAQQERDAAGSGAEGLLSPARPPLFPSAPASAATAPPLVKFDLRRAFDGINRLMQLKRDETAAVHAAREGLAALAEALSLQHGGGASGDANALPAVLAQAERTLALREQADRVTAAADRVEAELLAREERLRLKLGAVRAAAGVTAETAQLLPEVSVQVAKARDGAMGVRALLASKQLCLLAELRSLYPITEQDKGRRWSIRGVALPPDKDMGAAPDEAVSTALGYTAHTSFLLAKYLNVPLRYAPHYMASSSTMRDEVVSNTREFPLFGKGGDKEGMRVAVRMLQRCVKQLLASQGLPYADSQHVLCNLNRLYVVLLDAPLPDTA